MLSSQFRTEINLGVGAVYGPRGLAVLGPDERPCGALGKTMPGTMNKASFSAFNAHDTL